MRNFINALVLLCLLFSSYSAFAQKDLSIRFVGVKIFVHDLLVAKRFYTEQLGFEVSSKSKDQIRLSTNSWPILLAEAKGKAATNYPKTARTGLSLQTYKLLPRIDDLRQREVKLYDSLLSRNGVGLSIPFADPSGNVMTTIEVQIREIEPFEELKVYNTGVTISDMEASVAFYEGILGFEEWSRNYLPAALPLKHSDGSFAFMIHYKEGLKMNSNTHGSESQIVLLMQTVDLDSVKKLFRSKDIEFQSKKDLIVCRDPEGNYIEIRSNSRP